MFAPRLFNDGDEEVEVRVMLPDDERAVGAVARAGRHGLYDAFTTRHRIRIRGLAPGKTYSYRTVSKEITQFEPYDVRFGATVVSGPYHLTTLDPKRAQYSFLVFNDIHEDTAVLDSHLARIDWDGIELVFLALEYFKSNLICALIGANATTGTATPVHFAVIFHFNKILGNHF